MKRKMGLSVWFGMCLCLLSSLLPVEAATKPITDLGTVTLKTQTEAEAFYKDLLAKQVSGAYQVNLNKENVNTLQALIDAGKANPYSPYYFKPESQFGVKGERDLYYIGQAEMVMKDSTDFETFLSTYESHPVPDITLKLCNYAQNDGYPYAQNAQLNSVYSVQDKALYGGDYLRTIKRYIVNQTPSVKTYVIQNEADLKAALTESIQSFHEQITLIAASGMSLENLKAMLEQLTQTSPSPHFDFYSGFYAVVQQNVFTVQLYYDYPSDRCKQLLSEGLSKASEVAAKLITPQMDDYAKAIVLHDYLIENVSYDEFAYRFDLEDDRVHDFTGALFDKTAVCSGYASAYRMLLDAAGIENYYVSGSGQAYATIKKDHAWNIAKLGTQYYHVDSTWDDQDKDILKHRYFALSDLQLALDHTWNRSLYPACNDGSLEFFTKNRLVFESVAELKQFVQNKLSSSQFQFDFKSQRLSSSLIKQEITKLLNSLYPDGYDFTFTVYDSLYAYQVNPKGSIMLPASDPVIRGLHLNDLCLQNNNLLAVGDKGQILRMQLGSKGQILPKITDKNLLSITYGNRYYLAAGEAGTLLLSVDGVRFNTYKSPTKQTIRRAKFLNNKFWLMGDKGFLAYSENAIQWTVCKTGTGYALNDMIVVNGKYFVVGEHGTLLTSTNSTLWTLNKTATASELKSIAYGSGVYLTGGSSNTLLKSTDGKRWQQIRYEAPLQFNRLVFGNSSFMAVGDTQRMLIETNNRYTYINGRPLLNGILMSGKTIYIVGDKGQLYTGENSSIKVLNQILNALQPK